MKYRTIWCYGMFRKDTGNYEDEDYITEYIAENGMKIKTFFVDSKKYYDFEDNTYNTLSEAKAALEIKAYNQIINRINSRINSFKDHSAYEWLREFADTMLDDLLVNNAEMRRTAENFYEWITSASTMDIRHWIEYNEANWRI